MSTNSRIHTILLVDDISTNLELLSSYLNSSYKTAIAKNGEMAIQRAELLLPSLILLDIQMPGIDGYETCRRLKENPKTKDIPVIFMTALHETTYKVNGFAVGGVDYITKPVDGSELLARVETHIQLYSMQLELARLNSELEAQNAELELNSKRQKRVEQILRHDMKSPLQVMFSLPDLIAHDENLTSDQVDLIKCVEDAAKSMLNLIDSSLMLYKMESGNYTPHLIPIDIKNVLQNVAVSISNLLRSKQSVIFVNGEELSECESYVVPAEEILLSMLFSNCIKNAIEASPAKEPILLYISKGEMVSISISNKGSVPESIRENFFEELVTSGKEYGTGIGTYSARLVCQTLGGSIDLDCSVEGQTTLEIKLPGLS